MKKVDNNTNTAKKTLQSLTKTKTNISAQTNKNIIKAPS